MGRHDRQQAAARPAAPPAVQVQPAPLEEQLAAEALRAPPATPEPSYWQIEEDFSQSVRGTYITYRAGAIVSSKRLPSVIQLLKQFGAKMRPVPEVAVPILEALYCPNCTRHFTTGR